MDKNLKMRLMFEAIDKMTRPFKDMISSSEKMQDSVRATAGTLKKLKQNQEIISQFRDLRGQTKRSAEALDDKREIVRRLHYQLKTSKNPTQKLRNEYLRAKKAVESSEAAHNKKRATLSQLQARLKSASIDTRNLAGEEKRLAGDITKTNLALAEQARKLDKVRQRTRQVEKAKQQYDKTLQRQANISFVGMAGYQTGRTTLGGIGQIVAPGIQFEEQMSKVGALARVDKTSQQFAQLQTQAQSLGATTHFTATQAAQGMGYLAMAGFKVNEIMSAMPGTLNLAKIGSLELGEAADISSNILSGFKLDPSQMENVSDVLAATATRSNVDIRMMGETMTYVAPIASKFGASLEETAALTGMLGNVGIQGSMAGTSMRTMYNNIASHKPAQEALSKLGIQAKDANGNMRAMPEILADVARKTENLGSGIQLEIFKDIAGKEAGAAFAELVGQGGAGAITKFEEILHQAQGEAKRIADAMGDNTAGDIKAMQSAWEGLNITLTQTNTSPLRDLISQTTAILKNVNEWVKANPELAGTIVKLVAIMGGLLIAGGAIAMTIAGILGPIAMAKMAFVTLGINLLTPAFLIGKLKVAFWGIIPWIGKAITAVRGLNIVMLANPIGLVIAAIAALIGIGYLLYDNWTAITDAIGSGFDWIVDKLSPLLGIFDTIKRGWKSVFGGDEQAEKALTINEKLNQVKAKAQSEPVTAEQVKNSRKLIGKVVAGGMIMPVAAETQPVQLPQYPQTTQIIEQQNIRQANSVSQTRQSLLTAGQNNTYISPMGQNLTNTGPFPYNVNGLSVEPYVLTAQQPTQALQQHIRQASAVSQTSQSLLESGQYNSYQSNMGPTVSNSGPYIVNGIPAKTKMPQSVRIAQLTAEKLLTVQPTVYYSKKPVLSNTKNSADKDHKQVASITISHGDIVVQVQSGNPQQIADAVKEVLDNREVIAMHQAGAALYDED